MFSPMRLAGYLREAYVQTEGSRYMDLAHRASVTPVYVGMILKGAKIPSDPVVVRLARALGLDPAKALEFARRDRADRGDPSINEFIVAATVETELVRVPEVGRAWAGEPLMADEHVQAWHLIPRQWTRGSRCYMLRVDGDSMIGDGIHDGDMILVARDVPVEDGAIVVARVNDEVTVKRYRARNGSRFLEPSNPDYPPIDVTHAAEFEVIGKVVWSGRQHK